jgi:dTDP-4-dehydrorhamnose reductase
LHDADERLSVQRPLEIWGGVECTVNRVGNAYYNQLVRGGHAGRLSDLDRIAGLGIRTLRYPILWELNGTEQDLGGDWHWARERLSRLRELDILPIVGLVHHGSGPPHTSLTSEGFASGLATYARSVACEFPWVEWYTPVNEPLTTARFSGLYGHWYPHGRDNRTFARALINQCRATVMSMWAIREINPQAKLLQTDDLGTTYSTAAMQYQADFDNERRWLGWDLLSGRVGRHHPLRSFLIESDIAERELEWFCERPCPPDMIGVNHYATSDRFLDERLDRYPSNCWGGNTTMPYADIEAVRIVDPPQSSWTRILYETWKRYHLPLALSEVHLGCTREEQLRWFTEAWTAANDARQAGVDVVAMTAWALFGSFDWNTLLTRSTGHYEPGVFDIRGVAPKPTALAHLIREVACGLSPTHPVLKSPGWWRRGQRLLYGEARTDMSIAPGAPQNSGQPLLLWGSEMVTEVFLRVCEDRGLPCRRGSIQCDQNPAAAALIDRIKPWAMIYLHHCLLRSDGEGVECSVQDAAQEEALCLLAEQRGMPLLILGSAVCSHRGICIQDCAAMDLEQVANRALDLVIDQHQGSWYLTGSGEWHHVSRMSTIACAC